LLALANPALAAGCATPSEAAALKTAVIQQELMVAALQCHETKAYNRFVMTYRDALQSSDATLKTFFIRRGGEAGYDTFKTKAANLSALEQARNAPAFCADAHALYAAAFNHQGNLMSFVETHAGSADLGGICTESRPMLVRSDAKPMSTQAVKIAGTADIGGVPAHSLPAIPFRRQDAAAPPPRMEEDAARDDDEDDAAPYYAEESAPRRPRDYDIRQRDYYAARGYAPPAYGPPPGWQRDWRDYPPPPRPRYGWRDPDDRW
jgi:hypothetical protein